MSDLKIRTLNVEGINNVVQCKKQILSFLKKKEKCTIAFLQETHLGIRVDKTVRIGLARYITLHMIQKSHSVAILLHKTLLFPLLDKVVSYDERRHVRSSFSR